MVLQPRYTVLQLIEWTAQDLAQNGAESPRLDAELLLARAMNLTRTELLCRLDHAPDPEAYARFQPLSYRRTLREPVAYILGEKPFHDLRLKVTPAALIPRPETEILVETCLHLLRDLKPEPGRRLRVLDLGTGSGAIVLALAHGLPDADYLATDASPDAIELARENARRLGLEKLVRFRQGDHFEPVAAEPPFHLIACNPPYIPSGELDRLMPEASVFEPRAALDGGPDGLRFIASILLQAPERLAPGGSLVLEVGDDQAPAAAKLAPPSLEPLPPIKDLAGIERVLLFRRR
jgi:release factor glutamine methyltransferase